MWKTESGLKKKISIVFSEPICSTKELQYYKAKILHNTLDSYYRLIEPTSVQYIEENIKGTCVLKNSGSFMSHIANASMLYISLSP